MSQEETRHILVNHESDAAGGSDADHVGDDAFVEAGGAFVPASRGGDARLRRDCSRAASRRNGWRCRLKARRLWVRFLCGVSMFPLCLWVPQLPPTAQKHVTSASTNASLSICVTIKQRLIPGVAPLSPQDICESLIRLPATLRAGGAATGNGW